MLRPMLLQEGSWPAERVMRRSSICLFVGERGYGHNFNAVRFEHRQPRRHALKGDRERARYNQGDAPRARIALGRGK